MRKSEITPELIELSKRAKELGFPQDVETGEWIQIPEGNYPSETKLIHGDGQVQIYQDIFDKLSDRGHFMVLSFDISLAWLREKGWSVKSMTEWGQGYTITIAEYRHPNQFISVQSYPKTHHEAIAKAVIKVLEGEK